jgi:predicted dienelactone hydrolase
MLCAMTRTRTRTILGSILAAATLSACGGDDPAPSPQPDAAHDVAADTDPVEDIVEGDAVPPDATPDDTTEPDDVAADTADLTEPPACGPDNRQACLYRPSASYAFDTHEVRDLTYTDVTGAERKVHIAIYRPLEAPTPAPVVLLSHGGAGGKTNPFNSMEHWAPVFAEAGYVAVAIAHEGRDEASYQALCDALETNPDHFCTVKVSWDRPHDVRRVLTYLDERAAGGQFAGLLDMERIAHVGHSAGASAALMSVGVTRNFKCALPFGIDDPDQDCQVSDLVSLAVDRVDVAISMSPQGPDSEGFMAESYGAVDKPVLMATGANDGDPGEPENRASLFPLLPEGDKFRLFIDDQGAKHTLFEGSLDACTPIAGVEKCTAMRRAIFSTGLAFLDAHLRGDAAAAAWLASDDLVTAGGGLVTFDRR